MSSRFVDCVIAICIVSSLAGCHENKVFKEHTVRRQDEAANVTLSVTLVEHWDDYVDVLSPNFTLKNGDMALSMVLPQTMAIEEKDWRSFRAGLKVDADVTNGDSPEKASSAEPAEPTRPELPGLTDEQRALSQDPMLEYLAATALYQEIQLLNRYIKDAALRHNYIPYIVRLQLGVTPYARNMPYDVFTTLAFFERAQEKRKAPEGRVGKLERRRRLQRSLTPEQKEELELRELEPWARPPTARQVLVAPLLVTDNLEGALKSRAVDSIRQMTLALSALTTKASARADLQSYSEQLTSVLGKDLNSLLTIGQVTENSIIVRLGAPRQATAGYATVPRTHNVTVLVLVPSGLPNSLANDSGDSSPDRVAAGDERTLRVDATTELRHARTGKALQRPSVGSHKRGTKKTLKSHSRYLYPERIKWHRTCYKNLKYYPIIRYAYWTAHNEVQALDKELELSCNTSFESNSLWMQLIKITEKRPYATARFELPERTEPELPGNSQSVVLLDNEKAMTAVLHGGRDLRASDLSATLELRPKDRVGAVIVLTADQVEVDLGGRGVVKLVFPSLKKLKIAPKTRAMSNSESATPIVEGALTVSFLEDSRWREDPAHQTDEGSLSASEACKRNNQAKSVTSTSEDQESSAPASEPDHWACRVYDTIIYSELEP